MVIPTTTIRITQKKLDKLNDYAKARGWSQRFVIDLLIDNIEKCATLTKVSKLVLGEPVSEPVPLPAPAPAPAPAPEPDTFDDLIESLASQDPEALTVEPTPEPKGSTVEPEEAEELSHTDDIFDLLGGLD